MTNILTLNKKIKDYNTLTDYSQLSDLELAKLAQYNLYPEFTKDMQEDIAKKINEDHIKDSHRKNFDELVNKEFIKTESVVADEVIETKVGKAVRTTINVPIEINRALNLLKERKGNSHTAFTDIVSNCLRNHITNKDASNTKNTQESSTKIEDKNYLQLLEEIFNAAKSLFGNEYPEYMGKLNSCLLKLARSFVITKYALNSVLRDDWNDIITALEDACKDTTIYNEENDCDEPANMWDLDDDECVTIIKDVLSNPNVKAKVKVNEAQVKLYDLNLICDKIKEEYQSFETSEFEPDIFLIFSRSDIAINFIKILKSKNLNFDDLKELLKLDTMDFSSDKQSFETEYKKLIADFRDCLNYFEKLGSDITMMADSLPPYTKEVFYNFVYLISNVHSLETFTLYSDRYIQYFDRGHRSGDENVTPLVELDIPPLNSIETEFVKTISNAYYKFNENNIELKFSDYACIDWRCSPLGKRTFQILEEFYNLFHEGDRLNGSLSVIPENDVSCRWLQEFLLL